ncbi:MAG: NAD(P)H-dependent flavin oxidoreductase [Reyranellaceae bacterium]
MFKTPFTELVGIEYPIVQGGMQWVGRAVLAAAVSEAGGLGIITALTQPTPDDLRQEIAKARMLTKKPFGVNLTILPTLVPRPYGEYIDAIIDSGVKIVETAGNNPEPFLPKLKANGIKVVHKCTAVRHGVKAQKIGVDAISMDGFECAGHPGEDDVPNMILLPAARDKISIPMIASGGIGDARQFVAALALGADGVNMGTRFMATKEAPIHDKVKQRLVEADERETDLIFRTMRNTSRIARNSISKQVLEMEREGKTIQEIGPLVAGVRGKVVYETGDLDHGVWSAGMVQGLIHDIPSCKELIDRFVSEARKIIEGRLKPLAA